MNRKCLLAAVCLMAISFTMAPAQNVPSVTVAQDGQARAVIVVTPGLMAEDTPKKVKLTAEQQSAEKSRPAADDAEDDPRDPREQRDDEVRVASPDRGHAGAQGLPVGQKVGGVLIHSSRLSPRASLRQRCGSVDGKVRASPARSRA